MLLLATLLVITNSVATCEEPPFNPTNYLPQLPSLSMPYLPHFPLKIHPQPTTKVLSVVTKYIYSNPVCVKITGKKSLCKNSKKDTGLEHLVTKELTVKDRTNKQLEDFGIFVQGSEVPRPFSRKQDHATPSLDKKAEEILIEDRLDHLEKILPHYTRRRIFETSTITVTKVRSNNRVMATLLVRNCVPQGYDLCPKKKKKQRSSKVARFSNDSVEGGYFG